MVSYSVELAIIWSSCQFVMVVKPCENCPRLAYLEVVKSPEYNFGAAVLRVLNVGHVDESFGAEDQTTSPMPLSGGYL